ncbi:MAG TPA: ABC transporter ATP-binding protein [Pirellulales bacterium]|jgi:lipoprotein-releasing system ATP-binding protein|nr:ABC transporter ATP-binding protein [Pirellulales bacterium]
MAELVVTEITKQYPTRGEPLRVLRGVSCQLSAGENLAILGPSGCGKSTLLHIIGTLDTPTSGRIVLQGANPFQFDEPELATFRNHTIGFVFQDHHLLPQCSALENVLLPTLAGGKPAAEAVDRGRMLLERVGLADRMDHLPGELSGGERQRTAIARALVNRPALLLADEPTGNLDRHTAAAVAELLIGLQSQERAMLIAVTHSQDLAGMLMRRMELNEGQLQ